MWNTHEEWKAKDVFGECAEDVLWLRHRVTSGYVGVGGAVGYMIVLGHKMLDVVAKTLEWTSVARLFGEKRWPEFVEAVFPDTAKEYQGECVRRLAAALD